MRVVLLVERTSAACGPPSERSPSWARCPTRCESGAFYRRTGMTPDSFDLALLPAVRFGLADLVQAQLLASVAYSAEDTTDCSECRELFMAVAAEYSDRAHSAADAVARAVHQVLASEHDPAYFWPTEKRWLDWRTRFLVRQQLSMAEPIDGLNSPIPTAQWSMSLDHPDVERALSMLDPAEVVEQVVTLVADQFAAQTDPATLPFD